MRTHCIRAVSLVFMFACLLAARPAAAVVVLDQQNDLTGAGGADSTAGGYLEIGQTFTPSVTGTLSRIELQLVRFGAPNGNVFVNVYNTTGEPASAKMPTDPSLGTRTIPWESIPTTGYDYQVFDFSSLSIPIIAGTVMAYGVSSTQDGTTGGPRTSFDQNNYAGGKSVFRQVNPTLGWVDPVSHDNGFRIYVDVAAVNTPGDYNKDGVVDAADYVVWRKNLNNPSEAPLGGNGDNANGVDEGDYNLWVKRFGPAGGGSDAVPEPASVTLLLTAFLCAVAAARRLTLRS